MNPLALLVAGGGPATLHVEDVFSAYTYTGNGATGQSIVNNIDLTRGGLVWVKSRGTSGTNNDLQDTIRFAGNALYTNATTSLTTENNSITSFNSNGFSLGQDAGAGNVNTSGSTYASWTFRKAAKFFDVVQYTGNGSASNTLSHALGVIPGMILIKRTDATSNWFVWHRGNNVSASCTGLSINLTNAADYAGTLDASTHVSSTSFQPAYVYDVGSAVGANVSGATYIAYLFAHDASAGGIIQCGSFTTDASGNATVSLGWEPQYLLYKASSVTDSWRIEDTSRGWDVQTSSNVNELTANTTNAESPNRGPILNSTGFISNGIGASITYIYMAIRRGPMRVPTSGTQVYNAINRTGTGATASITGVGFGPDWVVPITRAAGFGSTMYDRLRGPLNRLQGNTFAAEVSDTGSLTSFNMDGVSVGADSWGSINGSGVNSIDYFFRRAPGFFDEVCYAGSSITAAISHNLTVVPELIVIKQRDYTDYWAVYSSTLGTGYHLQINTIAAQIANVSGSYWANTAPSNTTFTVDGSTGDVNALNHNYVAYLFASCPGVSKIGTYTGNGTNQNINCGFSAGARFVLIKRTDSTGDWWVFDTVRGIIVGNDPALALDNTSAEVTTVDSIAPYAAGFNVIQNATTNLNVNTATYLYFAIS